MIKARQAGPKDKVGNPPLTRNGGAGVRNGNYRVKMRQNGFFFFIWVGGYRGIVGAWSPAEVGGFQVAESWKFQELRDGIVESICSHSPISLKRQRRVAG